MSNIIFILLFTCCGCVPDLYGYIYTCTVEHKGHYDGRVVRHSTPCFNEIRGTTTYIEKQNLLSEGGVDKKLFAMVLSPFYLKFFVSSLELSFLYYWMISI